MNKIETQIEKRYSVTDVIALLCSIIAVFFVPLFIYVHTYFLNDLERKNWNGLNIVTDLFSYGKAMVIIFCGLIIGLLIVYRLITKQFKAEWSFALLGVYALFILLSTFFSKYMDISLMGFVEKNEGALVLLSYLMLFYAAYTAVVSNPHWIETIRTGFLISGSIIALFGFIQFLGINSLNDFLFRYIFLLFGPKNADITYTFTGQHIIYSTLFNPNYVGSFAVLFIFIAIGYTYQKQDERFGILRGFIFTSAASVLLFGSMSRAGFLGFFTMLIVLVIVYNKTLLKKLKSTLSWVLSVTAVCLLLNFISQGAVINEIKDLSPLKAEYEEQVIDSKDHKAVNTLPQMNSLASISSFLLGSVSPTNSGAPLLETANAFENSSGFSFVKNISIDKNRFIFETETETMILLKVGNEVQFLNEKYEPIQTEITKTLEKAGNIEYETAKYTFKDAKYKNYNVTFDPGAAAIFFQYSDVKPLPLVLKDNQFYIQYRQDELLQKAEFPPAFGFERNLRFGSGRGYIWSRTIPMLKDTLFLGFGPDTFTLIFPQRDIVGKYNGLTSAMILVDKPHNWYLQIAISTGVISLLAVIIFLMIYAFRALATVFKKVNHPDIELVRSILLAVGGYCVAAMFNDSIVGVAPVFWVLLGIGVAYNKIISTKETVM